MRCNHTRGKVVGAFESARRRRRRLPEQETRPPARMANLSPCEGAFDANAPPIRRVPCSGSVRLRRRADANAPPKPFGTRKKLVSAVGLVISGRLGGISLSRHTQNTCGKRHTFLREARNAVSSPIFVSVKVETRVESPILSSRTQETPFPATYSFPRKAKRP